MATLLPTPSTSLLAIRLKPSIRLAGMLSFAHLAAIVLLLPLELSIWAKFAGSALLVVSLVFYVRRYALLRSPDSISGLELTNEMVCTVETKGGDRTACALLGSSFVAPYLTVLELMPLRLSRDEQAPRSWRSYFSRSVVILPDGIDPEEFRQLRVSLRWKWKDMKI